MTVEELIAAAEQLPLKDQVRLLDEVTQLVAQAPKTLGPATALRGVGHALRNSVDAQEYVNHERNSWGG
ncbi:MAG: hypothetical protein ACR2JC_16965 [Chloroflexota bacterium]